MDVFRSQVNIENIYNDVRARILSATGFDINAKTKYRNTLPKLMESVLKNNNKNSSVMDLNRKTVEKVVPFMIESITKEIKRPSTGERLAQLQAQRGGLSNQVQIPPPMESVSHRELGQGSKITDKKYQQLLSQRQEETRKADLLAQSQGQPSTNSPTDFNVLPYTLDSDIGTSLSNPEPRTVVSGQTVEEVSSKYQQQQQERDKQTRDFQTYQENFLKQRGNDTKELMSDPATEQFRATNSYLEDRSQVERENTVRSYQDVDPTSFFKNPADSIMNNFNSRQKDEKTIDKAEEDVEKIISNLDKANSLLSHNPLYEIFLSEIKNSKRNYHEVSHYFTVSSADRNWKNDAETRYNFTVHFNPSDTHEGAGVNQIYKNVLSVEVMRVTFPHDHYQLPFDHRIYLDTLHYPFLVLNIPELDRVFQGTNSNINNSFAHLIFDKNYDSEILTDDLQNKATRGAAIVTKQFDRQYSRGFMTYTPLLFEKKRYLSTPLASLNRMTIKFNTPDGQSISNAKDSLIVSDITYEDTDDIVEKDLIATGGFPEVDPGSTHQTLKITTTTFFSNRTFKIGDKIRMTGYIARDGTNDNRFENFINREQGHYIINLKRDDFDSSGNLGNSGYISNMYISPPGEVDLIDGSGPDSSFFTVTDPSPASGTTHLINMTLQTYLHFKIVTREDDTMPTMKPFNV